ncbi:MAG: cell wall hydrolase [Candidatus Anammoxibacter sp.]
MSVLEIIHIIALFLSISSFNGDVPRQDIYCLARAVYHEARGEEIMGQFGVAWVIKNRVDARTWYGEDICSVVFAPKQFSGLVRAGFTGFDARAWRDSIIVSLMVWADMIGDPTGGALNYYAFNGINALRDDPWPELRVTIDIGNHRFKGESD